MRKLIGLIFFTLITGGKMSLIETALYTSPDTALKFSHCLIDKMTDSPYFTLDDRNSMLEVQDVMFQALHNKGHSLNSAKILTFAFATSIGSIIVSDDDALLNANRKGIYFSALEECSLSLIGYIDTEIINEAHNIISVIESEKIMEDREKSAFSGAETPDSGIFGSAAYSQASNLGNPFAVQPSPVQNPPAPQYFYPNDKTVFEPQEKTYSLPFAPLSQTAPNPQYPAIPSSNLDTASGVQAQSGSVPQPFDFADISQTRGFSPDFSSSKIDSISSFGTGMQAQSGSMPQASDFAGISQTGGFSPGFASNAQYENFPKFSDASRLPQSDKDLLAHQQVKHPFDYDTGSLSVAEASGKPQSKSGLSDPHSGSIIYDYDPGVIAKSDFNGPDYLSYADSSYTAPINDDSASKIFSGGLIIPQAKESAVVVIPPKTDKQFKSDEHYSQNQQGGAEKQIYFPQNEQSEPKSEVGEFSKSSLVTIPEAQYYDYTSYTDYFSYQELENVIMNILTNSPKFRKAFNSEISQEQAINLARALTEQTFAGYNSDIVEDALFVVTDEVYKVRVPSPETFAFALANALVAVLMRHDSSLSDTHSKLASNFLSSLDNSGQFHSHQEMLEKEAETHDTGVTLEQSSFGNSEKLYPRQETDKEGASDYNTGVTLKQSSLDKSHQFYPEPKNEYQDYDTSTTFGQSTVDKSQQFYPEPEKQYKDYDTGSTLGQSTVDKSQQFYPEPEKQYKDNDTGSTLGQSTVDKSQQFYPEPKIAEQQSQDPDAGITLQQSSLYNSQQPYFRQKTVKKQHQNYNKDVTLKEYSADNSDKIYSQQETFDKNSKNYDTGVTLEQFHSHPKTDEKEAHDYYAGEEEYSEFDEKQTDFDFQSPPLSPEDRKDEMFSLRLTEYLSKSESIRNFFCNQNVPEDVVSISFSIIKASLAEYDKHVAPLAASVASSSLSELSKEGLCKNYAKTISEIVAEILEEKGINANAESIASKMELNLIQRQITPTESQKPPPKIPESETLAAVPELDSSFAPVEEIKSHHQGKTENTDMITSYDYKDVSDYEYTQQMTLQHASTSLSTAPPTKHSVEWAPDDVIDQKGLADYLTEKFHTLESDVSKENGEKYENAEENIPATKIVEYQENDEKISEESPEEVSHEQRKRKKVRKGGRRKVKTTTSQLDIAASPSDRYEEDENYYNPAATDEEGNVNNQDESVIPRKDTVYADSTESKMKTTTVELQPSFQGPVSDSEYSTANFQPNSGVTQTESDYTDSSIALAKQVAEIAESSSAFIRSKKFNLINWCAQINQLAPLVNIPILDYCEPIAAADYLLNVLRATVKILKGF